MFFFFLSFQFCWSSNFYWYQWW